jgi:hypothetical protein
MRALFQFAPIAVSPTTRRSKPADHRGIVERITDLLCVSAILLAFPAAGAKASDTETLSKMLAAAFIADQTVFLCSLMAHPSPGGRPGRLGQAAIILSILGQRS